MFALRIDALPERWLMLGVLFLVRLAMGYQFQSIASVSSYHWHDGRACSRRLDA